MRASLSAIYLRYYILALAFLVLLMTCAAVMIQHAIDDTTVDDTRRFMSGTTALIQSEFARTPTSQWPALTRALSGRFAYPLHIESGERVHKELSLEQQAELSRGDMVISHHGSLIYMRLAQSDCILSLGPLGHVLRPNDRWLSRSQQWQMISWLLITLAFGSALFLALRPVWRDLSAVRETAERLGAGDLSVRAPSARSRLSAPLAHTLNSMAARLQALLAGQEALSHAVAHELRTPLARLRFGLAMLDDTDDNERDTLRRGIDADVQELDRLIEASLSYAKLGRVEMKLECALFPLDAWLISCVDALRPLAGEKTLKLEAYAVGEQTLFANRHYLSIALRNLVSNALKYAQQQVHITAEVQETQIIFYIDDDGPGILEQERARIFEPFVRLDRSQDRLSGGYGLGLALVKLVLDRHEGSVAVSDSPLGGARFTLSLPRGME